MLQVRTDGIYDSITGLKQELEFGNAEQIKVIKDKQELSDQYLNGYVVSPDVDVVYTATVHFKCVCDKDISEERDIRDEYSTIEFDGVEKQCRNCKRRYIMVVDDGDLVIKYND